MTTVPLLANNDPCWCGSGRKYKRCHRLADLDPERAAREQAEREQAELRGRGVRPARDGCRPGARCLRTSRGPTTRSTETGVRGTATRDGPRTPRRSRGCGRRAPRPREVLQTLGEAVRPGITTDELDAIAHEECIRRGGYPSPLGYGGSVMPFPKSLCTSVNEVICHGIPDSTVLKDGDIVNCDVTIFLDGVHGDTNATFLVGEVSPEDRRLVEVTRECLDVGIARRAARRPHPRHRPGHPDARRGRTGTA